MAKLYDKLMNRVIKGKLTIESGDDVGELVPENIKPALYISSDGEEDFKMVDDFPSDFTGYYLDLRVGDSDTIRFGSYENGEEVEHIGLAPFGFDVTQGDGGAYYGSNGASKLNYSQLTHSLAELDSTLTQIVQDAIDDAWADGVSCTQEQWNTIKALLDKSLYFNYNGVTLIKSFTDDNHEYGFGVTHSQAGYSLDFYYSDDNLLYAKYDEI